MAMLFGICGHARIKTEARPVPSRAKRQGVKLAVVCAECGMLLRWASKTERVLNLYGSEHASQPTVSPSTEQPGLEPT